jgi:signal peptidase I
MDLLSSENTTSTLSTASLSAEKVQAIMQKGPLREYFESLVVVVIMALFGITFIVQAVRVPTGSMLNTILIGDNLLVNKFIFGKGGLLDPILPNRLIRRGDVIVFKYPEDPATNYVKRVVGLPGEKIEIRQQKVFINDQELPETRLSVEQPAADGDPLKILATNNTASNSNYNAYWTYTDDATTALMGQKFGVGTPYVIPANHYFVMGDNRDNSQDSRYWGTVPRDYIVGRALVVYWSRSKNNSDTPDNIFTSIIGRTRWSRLGTLIK